MTRENKLALVLGFGLMLFVGILVSDHFAARKAPALATTVTSRPDMGVPPLPPPGGEGNTIVYSGRDGVNVRLPSAPTEPERLVRDSGESREGAPEASGERPAPLPPAAPTLATKTYSVQEGDTFAAIAKAEYGRRSLGEKLAAYNGINPSRLRAGASIKLPPVADLESDAVAAATTPDVSPTTGYRVYRVQDGDNLYRIAEREMGTATRWKELQSYNDDVLKGSDRLVPGTEIKIPVEGRNSSA